MFVVMCGDKVKGVWLALGYRNTFAQCKDPDAVPPGRRATRSKLASAVTRFDPAKKDEHQATTANDGMEGPRAENEDFGDEPHVVEVSGQTNARPECQKKTPRPLESKS